MSPRVETGLFLDGLRCSGCVNRVEKELRGTDGVERAAVNFTTHRALVRFDPERVDVAGLVGRVESLGYSATPYDPEALEETGRKGARDAMVRVLIAAFLAGNVMTVALALYLGSLEGIDETTRRGLRWLAIALTLPAVTWCAWPFWQGAASGLRNGRITIDLPIVLGIGTAFAVNVAGTLAESDELFVDSAAVIVFLILLGRTLERGARSRAASAVERLVALTPATALRRRGDDLEEIPASELREGDLVVVPPGQTIPADGRVVSGATEVDESLLTGESTPVLRAAGDRVTGGTPNVLSEVEVEVTDRVGRGALARLAALLERAQMDRAPIQRLADRVAGVFAPSVLAVAAATALGWAWAGASPMEIALTAAAVLIVACPCALGLATPAAVTAAVGRAARLGVLVKSGESFESCASVQQVVLDKTGTLTHGRFAVEEIAAAEGVERDRVLSLAAAAEGASTHPVAQALRRAAEQSGVAIEPATSHRAIAGRGVEAGDGDSVVRVGSRALLEDSGIGIPGNLMEAGCKLADRGSSVAWVASGAEALGVIALSDELREDAPETVARLRAMGIRVSLVTGDHPNAASLVASRCGIDDVRSEVSPAQKVEWIRSARAAGQRIAMVGDGFNDAAALASADVGIGMAQGADVTLQTADLVVRAPRMGAVADAIELSRATLGRIRENLAFAVFYNCVAVPLAVGGWLHPLLAAVAMSVSSLVVTGNAVRLLRWRPRA